MSKFIISTLSVVLFLTAGLLAVSLSKPVWAQESDSNIADDVTRTRVIEEGRNLINNVRDKREEVRTEVREKRDEVRTEVREKREDVRGEVTEKREEVRTEVRDKREDARGEINERREELKVKNRENREELKQRTEERKEELKARVEEKREELKDRIEQKREELKERLETIRDERKKEVVERIDRRMDELNERLLDHFLNVLDKLGDVLVRIAERADSAEERGVDVSAVRTVIDEANGAIAAAKSAIEAQAGKTYTIQITDEEGLKTNVGGARQALHGDLAVVRETVRAAFAAVRNAATTLAGAIEAFVLSTSEVEEETEVKVVPILSPTPSE